MISMKDIAKYCGVSVATVSKALSGQPDIGEATKERIRKAADEGNCIFIGRAADYVLRDHPRRLSLFVTADVQERISTLMADKGMDKDAAARLIEKVDAARAAFYNFYSGHTWGAAASYDLCINLSRTGLEGAVAIVEQALPGCCPTAERT